MKWEASAFFPYFPTQLGALQILIIISRKVGMLYLCERYEPHENNNNNKKKQKQTNKIWWSPPVPLQRKKTGRCTTSL